MPHAKGETMSQYVNGILLGAGIITAIVLFKVLFHISVF